MNMNWVFIVGFALLIIGIGGILDSAAMERDLRSPTVLRLTYYECCAGWLVALIGVVVILVSVL